MKQPDAKLYDFLDQAAKAGREWAKKQPGYEETRRFRDGEDFDDDSAHPEAEPTGYPEPMTAAELKATVFPPSRFIVAKLIREGIPQTLDGDGGIGKSNVGEGFAVARAAGVRSLDKRPSKARHCSSPKRTNTAIAREPRRHMRTTSRWTSNRCRCGSGRCKSTI